MRSRPGPGGDSEEGVGKHGERGVPVPGPALADLVVVKACAFLSRLRGAADEQVMAWPFRDPDERPVVEPGSLGAVGAAHPLPASLRDQGAGLVGTHAVGRHGGHVAAGRGHDVGMPASSSRARSFGLPP